MTRPCHLPAPINDVGRWDSMHTKCFGSGGRPTPWSGPKVEGVCPAALFQVHSHWRRFIVDAYGENFDTVLPIRMLCPKGLDPGHRLLARPAPGRPKLQDQNFFLEVGGFYVTPAVEPHELDFGRRCARREHATLGNVVLELQVTL